MGIGACCAALLAGVASSGQTQLAYVRSHVLYVVPCDAYGRLTKGAKQVRVCDVPRESHGEDKVIAWTPSGQIAFLPRKSPSIHPPAIEVAQPTAGARPGLLVHGYAPAFSPDRSRVAFEVERDRGSNISLPDLWIMDLSSGRKTLLAQNAENAAWSRAGNRLSFTTFDARHAEVRVLVCEFPSLRLVRSFEVGNPCDVRFSPNGRLLAVHNHLSRPLSGHTVYDLGSGEALDPAYPGQYAPPTLEDWSPDNRSAIFDWRVQDPGNDGSWIRQFEAITRLDTGKSRVLAEGRDARFSPNGKAVMYRTGLRGDMGDLCWMTVTSRQQPARLLRGISQFAFWR